MRRLRRDSQSCSGRPRGTVRANYVGLPSMAGRGAGEGRRKPPGKGVRLSAPGSTVPLPKIAAKRSAGRRRALVSSRVPQVHRRHRRRATQSATALLPTRCGCAVHHSPASCSALLSGSCLIHTRRNRATIGDFGFMGPERRCSGGVMLTQRFVKWTK